MEAPRFNPGREIFGAALSAATLPLAAPLLAFTPLGDRAPVVILPGFGASDRSTAVMRAFLQSRGHRTEGWGLGRNTGNVAALVQQIEKRVEQVVAREGRKVRIVGQSLGGIIARELARRRPDLVERIVTMGTPVIGGPKYTAMASLYQGMYNTDLDAMESMIAAVNRERRIAVPVTAIYSKNDNVVAWQACIDPVNDHIEHVEVRTTHIGMGFDAQVFRIVADRLARRTA